jgi:SAM-dependent methyltransferase
MTTVADRFRLYTDLAWLWPLWGDPAVEYARYCDYVAALIRRHTERPVETLLNVACGGGKNVFNLKKHYRVTGLDLSPAMLDQARALNPECEFVEGDMRSFSLARTFDAILLDDGVAHMTSLKDLSAAFCRAFDHLNPGGLMVVTPDATTETFRQNSNEATSASGRVENKSIDVVFMENLYDPDPTDDHYEATIVYLIRENGVLRLETDHWRLGLFSVNVWKQALSDTGFRVHDHPYRQGADVYEVFACVKPPLPGGA